MIRRSIALVFLVLPLATCTGANVEQTSTPPASTTTILTAPPGGLVVPACDDQGACAAGFVLDDGVFYALDCAAIPNKGVSDLILGQGDFGGEPVTVNVVEGVSPEILVAISLPSGPCNEGEPDVRISDWTMAFPSGVEIELLLDAICEVGELSDAQRGANGC